MVFLGFGKFARADKIYALEPLVGRTAATARRTRVWVEGVPEPIVASRTERTILAEMGQRRRGPLAARRPGLELAERLVAADRERPRRPRRPQPARAAAARGDGQPEPTTRSSSERARADSSRPRRRGRSRPAASRLASTRAAALVARPFRRLLVRHRDLARSAARSRRSRSRSRSTTLTGSTLLVGLLGIAALVPLLIVPLYGGAVADAVDRRRLLLVSDLALAARHGRARSSTRCCRDPQRLALFVFEALGDRRVRLPASGAKRADAEARPRRPAAGRDRGRGRRLQPRARRRARRSAGLLIAVIGLAGAYAFDLATFGASLRRDLAAPARCRRSRTRTGRACARSLDGLPLRRAASRRCSGSSPSTRTR